MKEILTFNGDCGSAITPDHFAVTEGYISAGICACVPLGYSTYREGPVLRGRCSQLLPFLLCLLITRVL